MCIYTYVMYVANLGTYIHTSIAFITGIYTCMYVRRKSPSVTQFFALTFTT